MVKRIAAFLVGSGLILFGLFAGLGAGVVVILFLLWLYLHGGYLAMWGAFGFFLATAARLVLKGFH